MVNSSESESLNQIVKSLKLKEIGPLIMPPNGIIGPAARDKCFYVEQNGFITHLNLVGKYTSGFPDQKAVELSDKIGQFTHLENLWLSYINLSRIPDTIGNCVQLKEFRLLHSNLPVLPTTIGNWTQLVEFTLGMTNISKLPDSIGNWTQLEIFHVDETPLISLPNSIGNWHSLKTIYLVAVLLKELPRSISFWKLLDAAYFERTQFMEISRGMIGWKKVNTIRLNQMPLSLKSEGKIYTKALTWGLDPRSDLVGLGIAYFMQELAKIIQNETISELMPLIPHPFALENESSLQNYDNHLADLLKNGNSRILWNIAREWDRLQEETISRRIYDELLRREPGNKNYPNRENAQLVVPNDEQAILKDMKAKKIMYVSTFLKMVPKYVEEHLQKNELKTAIVLVDALSGLVSVDVNVWYQVGLLYLKTRSYDKAKKFFQNVKKLLDEKMDYRFPYEEICQLANNPQTPIKF